MFGCSSVGSASAVVAAVELKLVDGVSGTTVVSTTFGVSWGDVGVLVAGLVVALVVVLVVGLVVSLEVGVSSEVCTVVAAGDRVVTGLSASPSAKCWTAGTEPAAIRAAAPRATAVRVNFTVNRSLSFKEETKCFATFCQTGTYDMQRE